MNNEPIELDTLLADAATFIWNATDSSLIPMAELWPQLEELRDITTRLAIGAAFTLYGYFTSQDDDSPDKS